MLVAVNVEVWIAAKFTVMSRNAIFSGFFSRSPPCSARPSIYQVVKSLGTSFPASISFSRCERKGKRCFAHLPKCRRLGMTQIHARNGFRKFGMRRRKNELMAMSCANAAAFSRYSSFRP